MNKVFVRWCGEC